MEKDELYLGMRVEITDDSSLLYGKSGTIIDLECNHPYDCLVEFDEYVHGHSGLGWGTIEGKDGHCYWFGADDVTEIVDVVEAAPETYVIGYDLLFS